MAQSEQPRAQQQTETTVEVRATGHVRDALGTAKLSFTFEGDTLRDFAEAFFDEYEVRDLVIAESETEAATRGWAPVDAGDVPGDLRKNPEGEQTRAYARILINGKFNETLDGFDTELEDGDRVALVNPFLFCV
ncbi:MAG: MoaD/ThiS family protein [Haloquadratum sp.]